MPRPITLVAIALAATLSLAARCNPVPPYVVLALHGAPFGAEGDALRIEPPYISTSTSGCPRVEAKFTRVLVGGAPTYPTEWQVEAKWDVCKSIGDSVAIEAVLDRTGSTLAGKITASALPRPFTATLLADESLRFATQNTQMLPSFFAAGTSEDYARYMAERILASGYDFIALNEVFDEDIQGIFVDELSATFPYWVRYLDAFDLEDSGLQIFSRFPFQSLPSDTYQIPALSCLASDHGVAFSPFNTGKADCEKVAFLEYDACESDDCFSSKGAAYVRIKNPGNDHIYNVVFTHMQANYVPADYPNEVEDFLDAADIRDTRALQMADIQTLLYATIGENRVNNEDIFVLGDLNIDGHLDAPDMGFVGPNVVNIFEWTTHFDSPGFFGEQVGDAWARENAPKDPSGNYDRGATNASHWGGGGPGARLDYILKSQKTRMCAQHMSLTTNLRWSPPGGTMIETGMGPFGVGTGGTWDLSDHYGINMDANIAAPHCSPARADLVTPAGGGNITFLPGALTRKGQITWYRFDEKGTYSFQMTSDAGVTYRVYESTDLTTPAPPYKEETTSFITPRGLPFEGQQFRISEAPFYVRVYHPNRQGTGSYTLGVVKHDCASKTLACALSPGEAFPHELSPNPPLNGKDESWFELTTEATPGNLLQSLELLVKDLGPTPLQYFALELREEDGTTVVATDASNAPDGPTQKLQIDHQESQRTKYYLVVKRLPASAPPYPPVANSYTMLWTTDLTIFFGASRGGQGIRLWCLEENDGLDLDGDDEMFLEFAKVGNDVVVGGGPHFIGDFDAGTDWPMEAWLGDPIYFVGGDDLKIQVYELDGAAAGENDVHVIQVPPLPRHTLGPIEDDAVFSPGGSGKYRFFYNLTHGFDQ